MRARVSTALGCIVLVVSLAGCALSREADPNAPFHVPKQACNDFAKLFIRTSPIEGVVGVSESDRASVSRLVTSAADTFAAGLVPIIERSKQNLPEIHDQLKALAASLRSASAGVRVATRDITAADESDFGYLIRVAENSMSAAKWACLIDVPYTRSGGWRRWRHQSSPEEYEHSYFVRCPRDLDDVGCGLGRLLLSRDL